MCRRRCCCRATTLKKCLPFISLFNKYTGTLIVIGVYYKLGSCIYTAKKIVWVFLLRLFLVGSISFCICLCFGCNIFTTTPTAPFCFSHLLGNGFDTCWYLPSYRKQPLTLKKKSSCSYFSILSWIFANVIVVESRCVGRRLTSDTTPVAKKKGGLWGLTMGYSNVM